MVIMFLCGITRKNNIFICFYIELNHKDPNKHILSLSPFSGKASISGETDMHLKKLMQFPCMKNLSSILEIDSKRNNLMHKTLFKKSPDSLSDSLESWAKTKSGSSWQPKGGFKEFCEKFDKELLKNFVRNLIKNF